MTGVIKGSDLISDEMWREHSWVLALANMADGLPNNQIAIMMGDCEGREIRGLYDWIDEETTVRPYPREWRWDTHQPIWSHIIHPGCPLHNQIMVVHTQIVLLGSVPVAELDFLKELDNARP